VALRNVRRDALKSIKALDGVSEDTQKSLEVVPGGFIIIIHILDPCILS